MTVVRTGWPDSRHVKPHRERQVMTDNENGRREPSQRDNGGALLELALLTAIIALVIVAIIGLTTKSFLPS